MIVSSFIERLLLPMLLFFTVSGTIAAITNVEESLLVPTLEAVPVEALNHDTILQFGRQADRHILNMAMNLDLHPRKCPVRELRYETPFAVL
jgi:hypothetical protein